MAMATTTLAARTRIPAPATTSAKARHFTKLGSLVQLILVASILNAKAVGVCATLTTPELTNGDVSPGAAAALVLGSNAGDAIASGYDEKRSWNSLQGSWGKKRSSGSNNDDTGNWIPILFGNGGEQLSNQRLHDMPLVYMVNAAALERMARERQLTENSNYNNINNSNNNNNSNYLESDDEDIDIGDESGNGIASEKRAWKNLNAAWGKRRNAPAWNKFSGAWGKREPSWNNLKGMWGKRSSNWQKLHGGWGKRSGAQGLAEFN